ncbi:MAG: DUF4258 domain-containing protein [Candidatus Micrarchaeota archaeon]
MQEKTLKFEVKCKLNKVIRVTQAYWNFIITAKHPSVNGKEDLAKETLINADEIRVSKTDSTVFLYYKQFNDLFMAVVSKHLNGTGFIITVYLTDRIKEGNLVWKK